MNREIVRKIVMTIFDRQDGTAGLSAGKQIKIIKKKKLARKIESKTRLLHS